MLVVDAKKLTLTQNIVVAKIDIKRFWYYHKDVLQDFVDDKKYPDYHEDYKKALAYELSETDVDFNTMATTYIQYDYKPCGVLQHRDEIGQWTSEVNGWRRYMNLSGERILIKPYAE